MLKKIRDLFGRRSPKDANTESESPTVTRGPQAVHRPIPRSDLDHDAVKIVERLTRFEHRAYLVGGCVRDLLLDRHPKDFDIATSATPRQMKRVFRNCRIIGRRFRLAHIYFQNGKIIEVATFRSANGDFNSAERKEGEDGEEGEDLLIRDDNVFGTPEEDALRRDFTINSLFYDLNNETVLDHAGGLDDLRRRLVRTIGPPEIRFSEDPIRILRAIKFAARLDFEIERETLAALRKRAAEIPKAAAPRILEEINRYGREGSARRSFELLREHGVFPVILPELADTYRNDAAWETLNLLLERVDRRRAEKLDVGTGEILAALLIPVVADRIGWRADGTAEVPKGLELRHAVDDVLRPLALRLRVSRREQERCRQIIAILARMVPVERVRKSTRRAVVRRINFLEALWMLEVLGDHFGNQFATAFDSWKTGVGEAAARRDAREEEDPRGGGRGRQRQEGEGEGPRRRRRGGRRRGGRGRRPEGEGAATTDGGSRPAAERPASKPAAAPARAQQPKKWDDDYFFSALPTAPSTGKDDGGDRYGAGGVAGEAPAPAPAPQDDRDERESRSNSESDSESGGERENESSDAPRRRRRRRRRRRGPRSTDEGTGDSSTPAEGESS